MFRTTRRRPGAILAPMLETLLLAGLAGAMIPLGGWLAARERLLPGWLEEEARHSVIAFGGGALVAAVALVLVPEGAARLPEAAVLALFLAGGAAFAWLDRLVATRLGPRGQLLAMVSDFVPEAMALGALLAAGGGEAALLLALLIALQNLPEAFNAYREALSARGHPSHSRARTLRLFAGLALVGPLAAAAGHLWLADRPAVLGGLMVFAGGGILYLIFEDIAPQAPLAAHWGPPLGAVAGFALGLAGHLWLG